MNKKGISPLIATLILIAFSIGLGAIVMSWGKGYVEARAEFVGQVTAAPLGCGSIQLGLWQVSGMPQYCADGGKAVVLLENAPNSRIDNIEARIVGTAGINTIESTLTKALTKPEGIRLEFNTGTVGEIKQIKLIPIVLIDGERHFCMDKAAIIEDSIPKC